MAQFKPQVTYMTSESLHDYRVGRYGVRTEYTTKKFNTHWSSPTKLLMGISITVNNLKMQKIWLWFKPSWMSGICWLLPWLWFSAAMAAPVVDARLEAELDQYLQLTGVDREAAATLLQNLTPQITALTPAATKVRFNSYQIVLKAEQQDLPAIDLLLQQNW